jgi:HAD superfamily hydrolase (TIGR01509 family)
MSAVTLVLFDVNGVLYDYDRSVRVAHLAGATRKDPAAIDRAIWGSGFEDSGDAGAMDAAAYLRAFGRHLGHRLTADAWTDALRAGLTPIPPMLALAARLAARAKLAVLTNNNLLVRDRMDQLYPALRPIFGAAICVSSEFGIRKPEPEVYRRCLARLGVAADASLFIDDNAANVAGAEQAGLHGHHHTDEATLAARLAALGLT